MVELYDTRNWKAWIDDNEEGKQLHVSVEAETPQPGYLVQMQEFPIPGGGKNSMYLEMTVLSTHENVALNLGYKEVQFHKILHPQHQIDVIEVYKDNNKIANVPVS